MTTTTVARPIRRRTPGIELPACPHDVEAVALDVRCDDCDGAGMVQAPEWTAWAERHEKAIAARARELAPFQSVEAYCERDPLPETPEEIACSECDGLGYVLTPRGAAILQLIDRYRRVR